MRFQIKVHEDVKADIRTHLTAEGAQKVENFLIRDLSTHSEGPRQDRDEDPQAFRCQHFFADGGWTHTLDFTVYDGWEPDVLHVASVVDTLGKKLPGPGPPSG